MARIGMEKGEPLYHPMLNKSIERAQKKVEERNFEIRKHLLEYDDVLNQQRKFIYEQRDAILVDNNLKDRINNATEDMIDNALHNYQSHINRDSEAAFGVLADYLKTKFNHILKADFVNDKNSEQLKKDLLAILEKDIAEKAELIGEANLNSFIRMQYLQFIDRLWLDHLENMEGLREAVYLRHYAQKNPLTEYKLEGFEIFDKMVDTIREEIASRVHLVRIQRAEDREERSRTASVSASHGNVKSFPSAQNRARPSSGGGGGKTMTVVRTTPKVGRNDPCPCGSGRKYKHCHGR
jgi:preprotein translocase subunit SecA